MLATIQYRRNYKLFIDRIVTSAVEGSLTQVSGVMQKEGSRRGRYFADVFTPEELAKRLSSNVE